MNDEVKIPGFLVRSHANDTGHDVDEAVKTIDEVHAELRQGQEAFNQQATKPVPEPAAASKNSNEPFFTFNYNGTSVYVHGTFVSRKDALSKLEGMRATIVAFLPEEEG